MTDAALLLLAKAKSCSTSLTTFFRSISSPTLPQDHIIRFAWLGDTYTSDG